MELLTLYRDFNSGPQAAHSGSVDEPPLGFGNHHHHHSLLKNTLNSQRGGLEVATNCLYRPDLRPSRADNLLDF